MARSVGIAGARTTLLGQLLKFLIQLLGLVVLARLLTPEAYGLYGMVVVFTGVGALIGDFGLASASIQARDVTVQQRSNLFWINTGLGVVAATILVAIAQPIAGIYAEQRLAPIVYVAASVIIIQGMTTQFAANATRQLRFGRLAIGDILSQAVGLVVAVLCALMGAGVWALVFQQMAVALTLLGVLAGASDWRPGMPRRTPMRALLSFGLHTFGVQLLNFFTAKVDSFVVGKFFGASALGIYDRSYQVNQIPTQQLATPLTRVALPLLSRHQDDREAMQRYLAKLAVVIGYTLGGAILVMGANSLSVVTIVLGRQWTEVAPLLAILAFGGYFQACGYVYYWAFLSLGQTRMQLRFALFTRPVMIVLIAGGALYGLVGVAIGVSLGLAANWFILSTIALARVGLRPRGLYLPMIRALIAWCFGAWGAAMIVIHALHIGPGVLSLVLGLAGAIALVSLFLVIPSYRRDLRSMVSLIERRN